MTEPHAGVSLTRAAEGDLADIRTYTDEMWGEAQWLDYFRGLLDVFDRIAASPMSGRARDRFAPGLRSVRFRGHVIFYLPMEPGAVVVQRILHGARNAALWR